MTENFEKEHEFERLVLMAFDGGISEDDFRCLDDLLGQSSESRNRYFDLFKIHQSLYNFENILNFVPRSIRSETNGHVALSEATGTAKADKQPCTHESRRRRIGPGSAMKGLFQAAAVVIFGVLMVLLGHTIKDSGEGQPYHNPVAVATLDIVRGATWGNDSQVLQAGDRLFENQEIRLETGSARIKFDNNADVLIQAPVYLRLISVNLLYLGKGKLTAFAPPSALGFTVLTPVAEIVDYGTEFGVTVLDSGETETSVFEGEVDLRPAIDKASYKPQRITTGWSSKVDSNKMPTGKLVEIDESFYQRLSLNVKVNFQPQKLDVPNGYVLDAGYTFGDRGNGYSYGWSRDLRGRSPTEPRPRYRNKIVYDDKRYDTLIHMTATWEIAVPNGTYRVDLLMGDPTHTDPINDVLIEGVLIKDPDGQDAFDRYSDVTVTVSDGRLTLEPGPDGYNAKVCFIDITQK